MFPTISIRSSSFIKQKRGNEFLSLSKTFLRFSDVAVNATLIILRLFISFPTFTVVSRGSSATPLMNFEKRLLADCHRNPNSEKLGLPLEMIRSKFINLFWTDVQNLISCIIFLSAKCMASDSGTFLATAYDKGGTRTEARPANPVPARQGPVNKLSGGADELGRGDEGERTI